MDPMPSYQRDRAKECGDSQSNGSLMRITPLAVYLSKVEDDKEFAELVRAEASLTHYNRIVQDAAVCYCLAIRELIKTPGAREKAYTTAK